MSRTPKLTMQVCNLQIIREYYPSENLSMWPCGGQILMQLLRSGKFKIPLLSKVGLTGFLGRSKE